MWQPWPADCRRLTSNSEPVFGIKTVDAPAVVRVLECHNLKPKKPIDLAALKGKQTDLFDDAEEDMAVDEDDEDEEDDDEDETEGTDEVGDEAGGSEDEDDDDYTEDERFDSDAPNSSAAPPSSKQQNSIPSPSPTQAPGTSSPTQVPTPDPYFTHFDARLEHQAYKDAQQRLEEMHREKVTKVMKDWSDLEERYQDMRSSDPKAAEDFKKRMTQRFQKTVQALEEEGDAEKHQLVAMHQQRVMAHINERKKEAMGCYTQALNDNPPNTHRVQKCLQKLLRALHKDRHHTISHYRHLLTSSFEQAEREKAITLEHLTDIDKMVNQSLQMLDRFPELRTKIGQLMEDYIQALRSKDETPGSLLAMTRDAEAAILEKYRADVAAKQEERERQRQLEKQRKEQRKKERVELREEKQRVEANLGDHEKFDPETMEDEHLSTAVTSGPAVLHHEEVAKVAHAQTHAVSHGEPVSVNIQFLSYTLMRDALWQDGGTSQRLVLLVGARRDAPGECLDSSPCMALEHVQYIRWAGWLSGKARSLVLQVLPYVLAGPLLWGDLDDA
ncbi:hypothetical protein PR048_008105 [Dryococelus australis]|uniref:E2 domain-containing protein n=1 Tax=Dryococelus australis TaxID=614101 RepID=A0ABQ9HW57_9NEOP|nr:hypothetical protein PR048_008105 [Dryococelus australis]